MATRYVNGYYKPSFIIQKSDGTFLEEITLPITNEDGLIEDYIPEEVLVKLLNKSYRQKFLGWRISFMLHYDKYISADTMLKIKKIINYSKGATEYGECRVTMIPRTDNPARQFRVLYTGESLTLGIQKGGSRSSGHKMPILQFETISLVKTLPISNVDEVPIIPTDFVVI